MKVTNKHNLPETIVEAVKKWMYRPKEHSIGVSDLVNPPLIRYLKQKHWDELETDASELLWALFGQSTHSVLDKVDIIETLTEEKLVAPLDGYDMVLSGRVDLYKGETLSVEDYKVTSVYSFLLGDKPEWIAQLNVYAWLYRNHGFRVDNLAIHAILRDWMTSKAKQDKDYPRIPFHTQKIDLWDTDKQKQYIYDRVADVMAHPVRDCNNQEKWYRGEKFAVKKIKNKRAERVFETSKEADEYVIFKEYDTKTYEIEHRIGTYMRCESYCNVRSVCEFGIEVNNERL